jgi:hypothetical protein
VVVVRTEYALLHSDGCNSILRRENELMNLTPKELAKAVTMKAMSCPNCSSLVNISTHSRLTTPEFHNELLEMITIPGALTLISVEESIAQAREDQDRGRVDADAEREWMKG